METRTVTKEPGHAVVTAIWAAISKPAWAAVGSTFTPSSVASDVVYLNTSSPGFGVYWTTIIMKVALCIHC